MYNELSYYKNNDHKDKNKNRVVYRIVLRLRLKNLFIRQILQDIQDDSRSREIEISNSITNTEESSIQKQIPNKIIILIQ